MHSFDFKQVDVFSRVALKGNPLAVVFGAAVGILPFAAMFLLVRQLVRRLLRWLLLRRQSVAALVQPIDPDPPQR